MSHILLVEDYLALRLSLSASLTDAGYQVQAVASAEEATMAIGVQTPGLVVLDWMLPGQSGVAALREWRAQGHRFPVILLTARDAVGDRVTGLDAGANDYLVKPFATDELLARIRAQMRGQSQVPGRVHLACGEVDLGREVIVSPDGEITLTTKEAKLLGYLHKHRGRDISRDELLKQVWGSTVLQTRALDNTVMRLRAKVELDPKRPRHVLTVHGTGYRFEP